MRRLTANSNEHRSGVVGVIFGTGLWALLLTIPPSYIPTTVGQILFITSWILLPVALFQDIRYVRVNVDGWDPRYKPYILPALVPFLGALVGTVYIYNRFKNAPS